MRQRTLGILAVALLLGGATLEIATGIAAARTGALPSTIALRPALHRQQTRHGQFGPGFQQPGHAPGFQRPGPPPDFQGGAGPGD